MPDVPRPRPNEPETDWEVVPGQLGVGTVQYIRENVRKQPVKPRPFPFGFTAPDPPSRARAGKPAGAKRPASGRSRSK